VGRISSFCKGCDDGHLFLIAVSVAMVLRAKATDANRCTGTCGIKGPGSHLPNSLEIIIIGGLGPSEMTLKEFLIYPQVLKGGFILGGSGGTGVLVVKDEKTGGWGQPAFYTIGSVTFGLQIGGRSVTASCNGDEPKGNRFFAVIVFQIRWGCFGLLLVP